VTTYSGVVLVCKNPFTEISVNREIKYLKHMRCLSDSRGYRTTSCFVWEKSERFSEKSEEVRWNRHSGRRRIGAAWRAAKQSRKA
jgi:hypothetical protein